MNKTNVTVPSGRIFTIREQMGTDDEILSSIVAPHSSELALIHRFLAAVVLEEVGETVNSKITVKYIEKLPVRDIYVLLIKSRIFSLGNLVKFEWDFGAPYGKEEFVEDLNNYVIDYAAEPVEVPNLIPPYPTLDSIHVSVGDQRFKYDLLTGLGEITASKTDYPNINTELTVRNLQVHVDGSWKPVLNFSGISSRTLSVIRASVKETDPNLEVFSILDHPGTGEPVYVPLLGLPDFFFPTRL